ncbi:hypothetical protein H310_04651 [Aphanomyces invadans]|uniref:Uncharacterized protein n=1 Tax=Aphanomyces invadans TaxID=157072 RepID=A0A024UFF0_9STRA|nr:hypothetical protein H310_04651 [Aphanomyces invadans]ETW04358.1 hypothetical protein H310_04651 [Aphanomyces invadans]|eukprot:XP_008867314.1 hypothetical protein H310_04651 [Aphanomyces invadans]
MTKKHQQHQHHHRKAKRHRPHARAAEPSLDFLEALEAQRAKQTDAASSASSASPRAIADPVTAPKVIPGFYFDPTKKKYFPGNPPRQPLVAPQDTAALTAARKVLSSIHHLRRRELGGCLYQGHMDLLQLLQRAPRLSNHILPLVAPVIQAVFSTAGQQVTVVCDDGHLRTLRPQPSRMSPRSVLDVAVASRKASYANVRCVRYQTGKTFADACISVTALGGANKPGFLSVLSPSTLSPIYKLKVRDGWHHVWHAEGNQIALAATLVASRSRVHVVDMVHGLTLHAPAASNIPPSDVFAQAYQASTSVLNGTRSGHVWLWDLRSEKAAFVQSIVANPASVCALDILSDSWSILAATTAGAVHRWDLRRLERPVATYCAEDPSHRHDRVVDFAVSKHEQVVAVSRDAAVKVWSLRQSSPVATVALAGPVVSMHWSDPHEDRRTWTTNGGGLQLHVCTPRAVHTIEYGTEC